MMYPIGLHVDPKLDYCVGAFAHMQFVCVIDNSKFGQSEFQMIFFHQGLLYCWFKCFDYHVYIRISNCCGWKILRHFS